MNTSIFLAKLIGPCLVVIAAGLLLNAKTFHEIAEEFMRNRALVFLAGHIILPAGLATVLTHNVWVAGWPVIITILGWLAVIGGTIRIVAPQSATNLGRRFYARSNNIVMISGSVWLVVGAVLSVNGYFR